jgi:hypothetical protein
MGAVTPSDILQFPCRTKAHNIVHNNNKNENRRREKEINMEGLVHEATTEVG